MSERSELILIGVRCLTEGTAKTHVKWALLERGRVRVAQVDLLIVQASRPLHFCAPARQRAAYGVTSPSGSGTTADTSQPRHNLKVVMYRIKIHFKSFRKQMLYDSIYSI